MNELYDIYEKLQKACESGDTQTINACCVNWMNKHQPNPFKSGTPERQMYFKATKYYSNYERKAINANASKKKTIELLSWIVTSGTPNPYAAKKTADKKTVVLEEKEHVLGVVPGTESVFVASGN